MDQRKNIPQIRLAGFSDEWARRNVGELLIERIELSPKSNEYPLMAFIANEGVAPKGDRYDRSALVNDTEGKLYKKTEQGDFIYSSNNCESGSIGLNNYGNATISPVYSIFKPSALGVSDFLGQRLIRKDFIKEMVKWRQGVIYGQWRIHESDFAKIVVCVPDVNEQHRIGVFLRHIDSLIIDNEMTLEKIHTFKKSMLEKMFAREGECIPQIRFNGFSGNWNRRKIGDCFYERTEFDPYGELLSVTIGSGIKKFADLGRRDNSNVNKSKYKKVAIGDIAYNSMRMWQGASGYSPYNGIVSPAYTVIAPVSGIDSKFFSYMFKREDMIHTFQARSQGITSDNWNLKFPALSEIEISLPSELSEQRKIADYLGQFDNLILAYQHELQKLNSLKKALLEKMFV